MSHRHVESALKRMPVHLRKEALAFLLLRGELSEFAHSQLVAVQSHSTALAFENHTVPQMVHQSTPKVITVMLVHLGSWGYNIILVKGVWVLKRGAATHAQW